MTLNQQNLEKNLLEQAIDAVFRETGLTFRITHKEIAEVGYRYDAIIEIEDYKHLQFTVEIKRWAQQANFGALVYQIQQLPMKGLLVADYVNPNMAARLRELDVPFIDTVGNAYINEKPLYIYIKGLKKNDKTYHTDGAGQKFARIFQPTGLKILYALLRDKELLNAPYREIADVTGVALGTVGRVFNDLKKGGYLVEYNKKNRRLKNKKYLLEKWVEAYPEKLRPKLLIGTFTAEKYDWWQNVDTNIVNYGAKWGGEVGAAKLTGHLKPEKITVYMPKEGGKRLLIDNRLRKDPNGNIQIYKMFQEQETNYLFEFNDIVEPIIIYADLLATGDPRNIETARIIYDQYLTGLVQED